MNKLTYKISNNHLFWIRNKLTILSLSIIILSLGVLGIIEHKSPENLASLNTLGNSFIVYIEYHFLIIAGALGITRSIACFIEGD